MLERWRQVGEVTHTVNVCTKSVRTGLIVMTMGEGFDVNGWGALAT